MPLSVIQEVIQRVNRKIDSALCCHSDGSYTPHVCIICDKALKPSTLSVIQESNLEAYQRPLRYDGFASLPPEHEIRMHYSYEGENRRDWMKNLLLSPRASYLGRGRGRGSTCGYSACCECKLAVDRCHTIPKYAIANKYYFGSPPNVLSQLNDVELALLTPMKAYGFVFTYSGGKQRNLQGVVSYF